MNVFFAKLLVPVQCTSASVTFCLKQDKGMSMPFHGKLRVTYDRSSFNLFPKSNYTENKDDSKICRMHRDMPAAVIIDFCRLLFVIFKSHWLTIIGCSHFWVCTYSFLRLSLHISVSFFEKEIRRLRRTVKMETTQFQIQPFTVRLAIFICICLLVLMPSVRQSTAAANTLCTCILHKVIEISPRMSQRPK